MKKVIGLILVFILLLAAAPGAMAGTRPKITRQPETVTVKAGGTVSFSIRTSGTVHIIIWRFTDPVTGKTYTGKSLPGAVKGLKVLNPNKNKITLSKVPESMHGWTVYAHVNGNGYKLDSETVQLQISGMDVPAEELPEVDPAAVTSPAESSPSSDDAAEAETSGTPETGESNSTDHNQPAGSFTVSASSKILKRVDDTGSVMEDLPADSLEFEGCGHVLVTSDDPIISWTLNGICVQPDQPVKEFRITNITSDLVIDILVQH